MKNLKLISWNVNGLRAVLKKGFFDFIKAEDPDILCLQETKAHEDQLGFDVKEIEGYDSHFSAAKKKGYSGVAIYSKIVPDSINRKLGIAKFDKEGRILMADYKDFILFNVYFPNGKASKERLDYKMDFNQIFLEYIKDLLKKGKKIVICGDVNTAHKPIDLARPKANEKISGFLSIERAWIDQLLAAGFIDTLRVFNKKPDQYSWWSLRTRARDRNVGWRIDYFFVSENLTKNLKNAFILPEVMGSDHCPVGIELEF